MTSKRTVQLSGCGVPSAFDYSREQNLVAVSSSSELSFYRLDDLGTPSQVISFEQNVKCSQAKFQHGGQGLVSCVHESVVSVWDPSRNVKALLDFIPDSKRVTDATWCSYTPTTLATCSNAGNLTLWDVRASLRPTHDFVVGKPCGKISWCPYNPYLFAATCEDSYVLVWDARMMPAVPGNTPQGVCETSDTAVHVIESEERILSFAWSSATTAIYTTTENCGLDLWLLTPCDDGSYDSQRVSTMRSSLINDHTKILPGPLGERLALLHYRPRTGESALYMRRFLDPDGLTRTVQSTDSTYGPPHESPVLAPEGGVPDSFVKFGTSRTRILDMLWMNGGPESRGLPQPDSRDLDMMLLNEDGLLQILHVPSLSSGGKNARSLTTSPAYFTKRAAADGLYSTLKSTIGFNNSATFERLDILSEDGRDKSASERNSAACLLRMRDSTPTGLNKRYSLGGARALPVLNDNPQLMMVGPLTFQSLLEDDLIALDYGINHGYLEGWRFGRIDQFARRIHLELLIPSIDSYTITNKHGSNASFASYYRTEDLNSFYQQRRIGSVRFVELIITFPVKVVNFWNPTFNIENKSGLAFNPVSLSGLIIELTTICKAHSEKMAGRSSTDLAALSARVQTPHMTDTLLFQLTRSFRKRLFKVWEKIIESDRLTISHTSIQQSGQGGAGEESNPLSMSVQSDHLLEVLDDSAPYMKYLEPWSFRTPAARLSGGIFNGKGQLICFGNAKVCLGLGSPGSLTPVPRAPFQATTIGKHKSFANTLAAKILSKASTTAAGVNAGSNGNNGNNLASSTSMDADGGPDGGPGIEVRGGKGGNNRVGFATGPSTAGSARDNLNVTFVSPLHSASSDSGAATTRYHTPFNLTPHPHRRNSSESDDAEAESPRHVPSKDGYEDDEYQFTFDQETKESTPGYTRLKIQTSMSLDSGQLPEFHTTAIAPESLTSRMSAVDEAVESFRGNNGEQSDSFKFSSQTFGLGEEEEEEQKPPGLHFLQIYNALYMEELKLLYAYSLGPLSRRLDDVPTAGTTIMAPPSPVPPTPSALSSSRDSRGRSRGRNFTPPPPAVVARVVAPVPALTQIEAYQRAAACRHNSVVVQQQLPEDKGLSQFWNLLAVVLDMLTITDSGCLIGWNQCTIGLALLHRLYLFMRERADLQTFATALCVLGGSDILVDLLLPFYIKTPSQGESEEKSVSSGYNSTGKYGSATSTPAFDAAKTKRFLESVLYSYADVLRRWGEQLSATEVAKHINYEHFLPPQRASLLDGRGCEMHVKVCCYYCDKELEPSAPGSAMTSASNSTTSLQTAGAGTLVSTMLGTGGGMGSSSRRNGGASQVTFYPGTLGGGGGAGGGGPGTGPTAAATSGTLLWCSDCRDWAQRCMVCELAVRGAVSVCGKCGHGGHFAHMQSWFARSSVCPSGCGCHCVIAQGAEPDDLSDAEDEKVEFVEDGENTKKDIYDLFERNPPNYLEEIFNKRSEYGIPGMNGFWADAPPAEVYYEYSG